MERPYIPDEVRIGGVTYEVYVVKDRPLVGSGKQVYGGIDFQDPIINLDGSLISKDRLELTFIHEVIHGIIADREIDRFLGEKEEDFTTIFARGLYAFMKDNGIWFKPKEDQAPVSGETKVAPFLGGKSEPAKPNPDPYRPPDGFDVTGLEMEIAHDAGVIPRFPVIEALRKIADDLEACPPEYEKRKGFTGTGEIGIRYNFGRLESQKLGAAE